ncbi:HTH-type transcriptional regulator BetI [Roseovarius aestuarii]|uniref:HTH-type transcriptional regulator BetI n=1 Tax=Roseovarius aestuarii TaxID=475083 RepID=A0A1X7BM71_9RHOB|nr:HTH-type transcriptional regulator BetI [Roseovarius aestuarii]
MSIFLKMGRDWPPLEALHLTSTSPDINGSAARKTSRRDPENSRRALIAATLDTIAEIGITDTTVSKIIERAELSRGMIHLHFGGKNQLLVAAAQSFGEEYFEELERGIQDAAGDPEAIIMAVIRADLGEALMNERSTRIWHAFRGAAHANDGIALYSSTRDKRLRDTIRSAFRDIARDYDEKDDPVLARDATFGLIVLLEGMWVDYLSNPHAFSREAAVSIIRRFISGLFPRHFR